MILSNKHINKGADQTAWIGRLVCDSVVRKHKREVFLLQGPYFHGAIVELYANVSQVLTLFEPMECSIKFGTVKSGRSIVYIEGSQIIISKIILYSFSEDCTVKTLYNVTRYNRIFNIQHTLLGTDLFPLKFLLYNRIFT